MTLPEARVVEMRSATRSTPPPETGIDRTTDLGDAEDTPAGAAPATGRRRVSWASIDVAVALLFLMFGYAITAHLWVDPVHFTTAPNSTDQTFFEWMLSHAVRVFTHGENPFFTKQLNAPLGVNLMSNTGLLGMAIPLAPLTAWLGPGPVFVLIIMLGLSGTAFAWYYVLSRHLVRHRFAAFVGAIFCGFGPGIMTHANAHPNLVVQFVVPFILWRALALRDSLRPIRDGVILGLLVTYQIFLNEELLFLTALAGTLFVIGYVVFRPGTVRPALKPTFVGLVTAGLVTLVLAAYPLWFQFYGPQHFNGLPLFLQSYRLPVKSFVTLPTMSFWGKPTTLATGTEQNSFLGWSIVIATVATVLVLWRRRPEVRVLAAIGVLFAYLSLGDRVSINGIDSHKWSLWSHINHWPLFDSALPSRLALVLVPLIGVLIAFGVADGLDAATRAMRADARPGAVDADVDPDADVEPAPKPGAMARWLNTARIAAAFAAVAGLVAAVVTIIPTPVQTAPRPVVPQFFLSGDWRAYVPAGSSVMSATPYDSISNMQWAIANKLDFSVPGGYFLGPEGQPKDAKHPNEFRGQYGPVFRTTMEVFGSIGAGMWHLSGDASQWTAQAITDLAFWHTSIIVLAPDAENADEVHSAIDAVLGRPGLQVDDVWVWDTRWTWTATAGS